MELDKYMKYIYSIIPQVTNSEKDDSFEHQVTISSLIVFQGDVIVSFDNVRVGCEGTVPFRSSERIAFRYLISKK